MRHPCSSCSTFYSCSTSSSSINQSISQNLYSTPSRYLLRGAPDPGLLLYTFSSYSTFSSCSIPSPLLSLLRLLLLFVVLPICLCVCLSVCVCLCVSVCVCLSV